MNTEIHVNAPFEMLENGGIPLLTKNGVNPEIYLPSHVLDEVSAERFEGVAEEILAARLSVTFHAPFADLAPGTPDIRIREVTRHRLKQVLSLVPLFRPKTVVCHAGYDPVRYGFFAEAWRENALKTWEWYAGELAERGTRLMLENVFEHGPEEMRFLFEKLERYGAGLCLDVGHQTAFSRTDLKTWLDVLGNRIGQLHLHDNFGVYDDHLAPGKGIIDFPYLFRRLKAFFTEPPVITLEPHQKKDLMPGVSCIRSVLPW